MLTETLLERTYRLLNASRLTYREIAVGAGVDINWLSKFKQELIGEPGVSKVQNLHDFLSSQANGVPKSRRSERNVS